MKEHINDHSLNGGSATKTWKLKLNDDDNKKYFQYFKIEMTQKNGCGDTWELMCSGMELYGDLCELKYAYCPELLFKTFNI